jgi:hypothetical protein
MEQLTKEQHAELRKIIGDLQEWENLHGSKLNDKEWDVLHDSLKALQRMMRFWKFGVKED